MNEPYYYNNLYRDDKGELRWSETGKMFTTAQQAWAEAAIYQGCFGWEYIATVSTGNGGTNKKDVDDIAEAIKASGAHPCYNATWDELCQLADEVEGELCHKDVPAFHAKRSS